ncbi:DMT family transporter [Chloroflexota bacterium]
METGLVLAILSSMCFGGCQVLVRRGTHQIEESTTATTVAVLVGTALFGLVLPLSGDWSKLWSLSWQGFIFLSLAGIIHFVAGRYCLYSSIRILGANKGSAIVRLNILFTVIFGVVFLHESITALLVVGALGIMVGTTLVSFHREGKALFTVSAGQSRGLFFALGAAILTTISIILVKQGVREVGSPYVATFVSFAASFVVMTILVSGKRQRDQLFQLPRSTLIILTLSGILGLVGQLLRYAALNYSPVSVVQPILGTIVLFVFFFSLMLNRKIDVFTWRVFTGILFIVIGTFLLFL